MRTAGSRRNHARTDVEHGFTLLEPLIVIMVLGILAGVVVFALGGVTSASVIAACNTDAKTVDVAVQAYDVQTGYTPGAASGIAPTSSNLVSLGYLKSFPDSAYYTISIVSGVVMVAAPSTAQAVAYGTQNTCSNASTAT